MAQLIPTPTPPAAKFANPLPVISTQYCTAHPVNLAVVKKVMTISVGGFVVTDNKDTNIFKVKGKLMTLRYQRVLLDAAGKPIVTLREKGESKKSSDLIFTVERSSRIQLKAKLHVFLANNTKEEVCDFMVEGSWTQKTCVVYTGDCTNIVGKMCKKTTVQSVLIGKDHYSLTVHGNVD